MRDRHLVLTEEDLHFLIKESVKNYLTENDLGEGWWGGVKNAWRGAKQGNFNLRGSYRAGNFASSFQKYAEQAQNAIAQMQTVCVNSGNKPISTSLGQISKQLQKAINGFNQMAQKAAAPQQVDTSVQNPWAAKKAAPKKAAATTAAVPGANTAAAAGTAQTATMPAARTTRRRTAAAGA